MNKKRTVLTVVAMVVFGAIILINYDRVTSGYPNIRASAKAGLNIQLLVLLVAYAGLFSIMGRKKDAEPVSRRPVSWRRIKIIGVILAGLVALAGLSVAIIYSHEQERQRESFRRSAIAREQANREEQRKRAAQLQEWEESKHRITLPELECNLRANTLISFIGSVRNGSAKYTLTSMNLLVTVYQLQKDGNWEIVGDEPIRLEFKNFGVPPGQTRQVYAPLHFHPISSMSIRSRYVVTDIRGSDNPFLIP